MEQVMYLIFVADRIGNRSEATPIAVAPTRELAEGEAQRLCLGEGAWTQAWVEEVDFVSEKVDFF